MTTPANGRSRRPLLIAAKAAIAAILLYLVFRGVDLSELWTLVSRVSVAAFGLAVALHVVGFGLGALRWWLMVQHAGAPHRFLALFPSYYLGVFCNTFLPTGIGGDVVRVLHARRLGVGLQALVASTVSDRLVGLCAVLVTGLVALAFSPHVRLAQDVRWLLHGLAAVVAIGLWLVATDRFGRWLHDLAGRFAHTGLRKAMVDVVRSVHGLRDRKLLLAGAFAISLLVQVLIAASYWVLALSLGVDQPAVTYLLVVPIVLLAAVVPISLGALGVREGVFVLLMGWAGTGKPAALAVSLTYLACLWSASLPGMLVWLATPRGRTDSASGSVTPPDAR